MKMQGKLDRLLTIVLNIVIKFQSIAKMISTLVVGLVMLAGFFESFVTFGKGSLDGDTTELSAVDILYIGMSAINEKISQML